MIRKLAVLFFFCQIPLQSANCAEPPSCASLPELRSAQALLTSCREKLDPAQARDCGLSIDAGLREETIRPVMLVCPQEFHKLVNGTQALAFYHGTIEKIQEVGARVEKALPFFEQKGRFPDAEEEGLPDEDALSINAQWAKLTQAIKQVSNIEGLSAPHLDRINEAHSEYQKYFDVAQWIRGKGIDFASEPEEFRKSVISAGVLGPAGARVAQDSRNLREDAAKVRKSLSEIKTILGKGPIDPAQARHLARLFEDARAAGGASFDHVFDQYAGEEWRKYGRLSAEEIAVAENARALALRKGLKTDDNIPAPNDEERLAADSLASKIDLFLLKTGYGQDPHGIAPSHHAMLRSMVLPIHRNQPPGTLVFLAISQEQSKWTENFMKEKGRRPDITETRAAHLEIAQRLYGAEGSDLKRNMDREVERRWVEQNQEMTDIAGTALSFIPVIGLADYLIHKPEDNIDKGFMYADMGATLFPGAALVMKPVKAAAKIPVQPGALSRWATQSMQWVKGLVSGGAPADAGAAQALKRLADSGVKLTSKNKDEISRLQETVAKYNGTYRQGYHSAQHQIGAGSVADNVAEIVLPSLKKPPGMSDKAFDLVRSRAYMGALIHDVEGTFVVVQKNGRTFLKYGDSSKQLDKMDSELLGRPLRQIKNADGSVTNIYPKGAGTAASPGTRSFLLTTFRTVLTDPAFKDADELSRYLALKGTAFSPQEQAVAGKLLPILEGKIRLKYGKDADAMLKVADEAAEKIGAADVFNHYIRPPEEALKQMVSLESEFRQAYVNVPGTAKFINFQIGGDPKYVKYFNDLPAQAKENFTRNYMHFKLLEQSPDLLKRGTPEQISRLLDSQSKTMLDPDLWKPGTSFEEMTAAVSKRLEQVPGAGVIRRADGSAERIPIEILDKNVKIVSDADRLSAVKTQMNLTGPKADAVVSAHKKVQCAAGSCSPAQLRAKYRIMSDAGMSPPEIREAIERGLAGFHPLDFLNIMQGPMTVKEAGRAQQQAFELLALRRAGQFAKPANAKVLGFSKSIFSQVERASKRTGVKTREVLAQTLSDKLASSLRLKGDGKDVIVYGEELDSKAFYQRLKRGAFIDDGTVSIKGGTVNEHGSLSHLYQMAYLSDQMGPQKFRRFFEYVSGEYDKTFDAARRAGRSVPEAEKIAGNKAAGAMWDQTFDAGRAAGDFRNPENMQKHLCDKFGDYLKKDCFSFTGI